MFKKSIIFIAALCCAVTLFGRGATTPDGWLDNFDEALKLAKNTDRPVLMLITGSDWCPSCIALKTKILPTKEFKELADSKLVLLFIDIPQKVRLDAELAAQNRMLAGRFQLRGVPTTVILGPDGKEKGRIVGFTEKYVGEVTKILSEKH